MTSMNRSFDMRRRPGPLAEAGAAFADLGTFLPLVTGMLLVGGFDPVGVLAGFGLFAVATGLVYRAPVPTQPMKAVAALAITGALAPSATVAAGLLMGGVLIAIAASGSIERLERVMPRTVLLGLQIGLGLSLVVAAIGLPGVSLWLAGAVLAVLVLAQWTALPGAVCLVLLAGGIAFALATGDAVAPAAAFGVHLPKFALPASEAFGEGARTALLPQLAMTITNAVLLTAALGREHFPEARHRITPRNLALSTGGLNLLLAPFGAVPMCHGAGGLAAMRAQGARTGLAPVLFGAACLVLGVGLGPEAIDWLRIIPVEIVAAFLAMAGLSLARFARLQGLRPACLGIIAITAAVTLLASVVLGLVAGVACEIVRSRFASLRAPGG